MNPKRSKEHLTIFIIAENNAPVKQFWEKSERSIENMQTINEVAKSYYKYACCLSDSPHAEDVKKQVSIKETDTAEEQFSELLKQVSDPDLRERLDTAAGRISYAYEKLGFVVGLIAERSLGCVM